MVAHLGHRRSSLCFQKHIFTCGIKTKYYRYFYLRKTYFLWFGKRLQIFIQELKQTKHLDWENKNMCCS